MQILEDRSAIGALADLLSWQSEDRLIRLACATHIQWSFERLVVLGEFANVNLMARVRSLPTQHQQRLILAPIVHHILDRPFEAESSARIAGFIELEEHLASGSSGGSGWTALGDCYRPGDCIPTPAPRGEWRADQEYRASTAGHLILDTYCAHYDEMQMPAGVTDVEPHAIEEIAHIRQQVTEALERIMLVSRVAATLIRECSQVLRLEKTDSQPTLAISQSHRHIIGRVGFLNAHRQSRWTVQKFMNDLVHESIHALVYKMELVLPLYRDYQAASDLKGVSPWTGRELNLHSFVHACLVWYGLWSFWEKAERSAEGDKLGERAHNGFRSGNPLDQLNAAARDNVHADVQALITELSERVPN